MVAAAARLYVAQRQEKKERVSTAPEPPLTENPRWLIAAGVLS
jgi:hypothetical protein